MRINWWVRFHNKTFLASFLALVIAFVYNLLALFGVTPSVQQDALLTAVNAILTVLGMIGVIADPTTKGISDSAQASARRSIFLSVFMLLPLSDFQHRAYGSSSCLGWS